MSEHIQDLVVFTGPTLPPDEAARHLDALFLPPAANGDVYAAATRRPLAIGIIDGYFDRVPSIWHKEVLWAMEQGVHVFGAASMGALRAAELHTFGMEGVGWVFEAFRDGHLENDDEVAVIHGPAESGYAMFSEALVNIRSTLSAALAEDVISAEAHEHILTGAAALHYRDRTWPAVLNRWSDIGGPTFEGLQEWLRSGGRRDVKREDALAMLARLGQLRAERVPPKSVSWTLQRTVMWEYLEQLADTAPHDAGAAVHPTHVDDLLDEARINVELYESLRERAITRMLALEVADHTGVTTPGPDPVDGRGSGDQDRLPSRLELEEARIMQVRRDRVGLVGRHLRDHLLVHGPYHELRRRAAHKQARLVEKGLDNPSLSDAGVSEPDLWTWFFGARAGREVPVDCELAAVEFGFKTLPLMRRAALRELLYLKLSAEVTGQEGRHPEAPSPEGSP